MKKIIDSKMYNTETAKYLFCADINDLNKYNHIYGNDCIYHKITLYQKKTGTYFLCFRGCIHDEIDYLSEIDKFDLQLHKIAQISEENAKNFVAKYGETEDYIEIFGDVEE